MNQRMQLQAQQLAYGTGQPPGQQDVSQHGATGGTSWPANAGASAGAHAGASAWNQGAAVPAQQGWEQGQGHWGQGQAGQQQPQVDAAAGQAAQWSAAAGAAPAAQQWGAGTQFTYFIGTKVQIITLVLLRQPQLARHLRLLLRQPHSSGVQARLPQVSPTASFRACFAACVLM